MIREERRCDRGHRYEVSKPTLYTGNGGYPARCPDCPKRQ